MVNFSTGSISFNSKWKAIIVDADLNIVHLNPSFAKLMKVYPDALLGKNLADLSPRQMPTQKQLFSESGFCDISFEFYNTNNEYIHLIINGFIVKVKNESYAVVFWNDITKFSTYEKKYLSKEIELNTLIYKISHDLRGPIASTKGLVNLMRIENPDKKLNEYIGLVETAILKLDGKVNDLGKVADLASSDQYYFSQVDMHELLYQTISDLSKNYDVFDILFDFKLSQNLVFKTYEYALAAILSNLFIFSIENKNHAQKLVFNLSIKREANTLIIQSSDNGMGIDSQNVEQIFSPFYRVNDSYNTSALSLFTMKKSVEFLNGDIKVKSSLGHGTIFSIQVPVA